jgi:hypothetical protein
VLSEGAFSDTTVMLNTGGWVFDDAEFRYTIALVTIRKGAEHVGEVALRGPYPNLQRFREGQGLPPARFSVEEFLTWSDAASFPLLPSAEAAGVFQKLRQHASLGGRRKDWRARPIQGDFNATTDKGFFILDEEDAPEDAWTVYKGASFNLWEPDTGIYYAWADPDVVTGELQARRVKGQRSAKSAFSEFPRDWVLDEDTVPCWYPRLAFRDVTNRTNTRTVIAALVPGEIVISNQAPYLLWPNGDERDQAYLLGMLCSMPLDWYSRRVVETHVNFHLFNAFPIPEVERNNPKRHKVEQIAGRLAAVNESYEDWAKAVGVPVGSVADSEKPDLLAELDALVAHLYGLDEDDLRVIYDTFHEGADYSAHRDRVLAHFRRLEG